MSRSVDLFIGSSLSIAEVAELLRTRSGAQLVPTIDPGRWRFVEGSVTAELYEHPYVDDGELWLSRYRYVLSTRMADGVGPIDSAEVLGLRHLAQVLHDPVKLPVLLVLDLQYRLGPSAGRGPSTEGSSSLSGGDGFGGDGLGGGGFGGGGFGGDGLGGGGGLDGDGLGGDGPGGGGPGGEPVASGGGASGGGASGGRAPGEGAPA